MGGTRSFESSVLDNLRILLREKEKNRFWHLLFSLFSGDAKIVLP